jgi:23S rRNA pseudouridine1911/1915/1917 synthase
VDRQYQALVWGHPEPEADTIDAPIGRDPHPRTRPAVTDRHAGKRAVTHYRVQARRGPIALLAYRLETGRTHQIRVHSQFAGHPVVGDPKYGGRGIKYGPRHGPRREELEAVIDEIDRQALHARVLGFTHPETGEELRFTSDWPEDMLAVWRGLRSFDES